MKEEIGKLKHYLLKTYSKLPNFTTFNVKKVKISKLLILNQVKIVKIQEKGGHLMTGCLMT